MQFEFPRQGFRCFTRPEQNWLEQQTRRSIRKKTRSREDRCGPNLRKIYARVPWMRFSHRGVDFGQRTSKSRVVVTEILPFGQVLLKEVGRNDDGMQIYQRNPALTAAQAWALTNSDAERRNEGVWCARLSISHLSSEAEALLLNKEFDAVWQGENVVLFDGKFDMTPRLGARPKPAADLPALNKPLPVKLIARQGSLLAVQNKYVMRDLEFLNTFEKDPDTIVLKNLEKRSFLLVWDDWKWKRAQVKESESSSGTMFVNLIDEAVDKAIPKVEELLGIAPTTWRQPPAAGILIELPEDIRSRFNVDEFGDDEVFCVLRKPIRNTKYAGQLLVKSVDGELVEISEDFKTIPPSTPKLGLCFVMNVDHGERKIHVVNAQVMDDHGTFLSEKIADVKQKRTLSRVKEGQAVLAPMADLLCRAEIRKVRADGFLVRFVDYGNSTHVNKVFAIPDELLSVPALAFSIPLDPSRGAQFEFGRFLSVTSIEEDAVQFIGL